MTMAVRNRASEMITPLGGACCTPRAVRKSDKTTTIRTNEVVMITIEGARLKTVIKAASWTTRSVSPSPEPRLRFKAWAVATAG